MTVFVRHGQELTILIFCAGIGAAIGGSRAGLKGLLVGAIAGPIVVVLLILGLFGAAWLVTRVKARHTPPGDETTEEDSGRT